MASRCWPKGRKESGEVSKKNLRIWTLPKEWVMNFVAAWRTFERTVNPAFQFLLRCTNCHQVGSAQFVKSVKGEGLIGLQCQTSNCGQTIKFGRKIGTNDPDFPERFISDPPTVLDSPDGDIADPADEDRELITELLFDE